MILYFSIHLTFSIYFKAFSSKVTFYQNIKSVVLINSCSIVFISLISSLTFFGSVSRIFILLVFILNGVSQLGFFYFFQILNTSKTSIKNKNEQKLSIFFVVNFFASLLIYLICYDYVFPVDINIIWDN